MYLSADRQMTRQCWRNLSRDSSNLPLPFLYENFRKANLATIPSDELETSLASFLQEHKEDEQVLESELGDMAVSQLKEAADFHVRARKYISLWCSDEKEYIRRYYNGQNIPVVELTPSMERLFTFLEEIEPKKFVGTESRFRTILFQLRKLYQNINEDPETRIESLKKQSEIEATKGSILGYTLDIDAKMRESAQGQSFSSFWNFIAQDKENELTENAMLVQTKAATFFPQARKPILPEKTSEFSEIKTFDREGADVTDLSELFNQFYIDEKELYAHIADFRSQTEKNQFTLKDLTDAFPIQKGLSELIAYFGIANKEKLIGI